MEFITGASIIIASVSALSSFGGWIFTLNKNGREQAATDAILRTGLQNVTSSVDDIRRVCADCQDRVREVERLSAVTDSRVAAHDKRLIRVENHTESGRGR